MREILWIFLGRTTRELCFLGHWLPTCGTFIAAGPRLFLFTFENIFSMSPQLANFVIALMMKTLRISETSVTFCENTRCNILEDFYVENFIFYRWKYFNFINWLPREDFFSWETDSRLSSRDVSRRFIVVFATACNWSLSWASWIQSALEHCVPKIRLNVILFKMASSGLLSH